jgi:hypothetical protein
MVMAWFWLLLYILYHRVVPGTEFKMDYCYFGNESYLLESQDMRIKLSHQHCKD